MATVINLTMRPRRMTGLVAALAVTGFALGCGSSGGSDTSTSSAPSASTTASNSAMQVAKATVAKYSQQSTSIGITEPLKTKPKGPIWILQCAAPTCIKQQTAGVKAATKVLGIGSKAVPLGATPESATSAWNTASNANPPPGGIIAGGPQFQTVAQQVAKLATKKVPIVPIGNNLNNKSPQGTDYPGVDYDVDSLQWVARSGKLMADWIGVDNNGAASDVLYVTIPDFKLFGPLQKEFRSELGQLCSACSVKELTVNVSGIATTIPAQVVSALQRNPKIKYIVTDFGDMMLGVPEALKAASLTAKLVSQSGSAKNLEYIKNGQQALDVAANSEYTAWQAIDAIGRLSGGQPVTPALPLPPTQFVTKVGLDNGTVKVAPDGEVEVVADYQAQWTKLWAQAK